MISTPSISFIHTRELVPSDGPMATPIFAVSRAGEEGLKLLTRYGLAQDQIGRIKELFDTHQRWLLNHFRTSRSPLTSKDERKTYCIFVFYSKERLVGSCTR